MAVASTIHFPRLMVTSSDHLLQLLAFEAGSHRRFPIRHSDCLGATQRTRRQVPPIGSGGTEWRTALSRVG